MLLEVEGLTKRFGGLVAVDGVNFSVAKGEILGLIGPNGSGKTTAFNPITGFLRPNAGAIRLDGRNIAGRAAQEVCRIGIARTFQHVKPFAGLTVRQNVEVAARFGREPSRNGAAVRERCDDALTLTANPRLLLLDELMAGLTPAEQDGFVALIRQICGRSITVVMVEHIMRVVGALCDRVVVLDAGAKIAEGKPETVLRLPQVVEAYLREAI